MNAKRGRPKLDVTRTLLLAARFTPAEAQRIEAAATSSTLSKSEWIRQVLLTAAAAGYVQKPLNARHAGASELGSEFLD